MHELLVDGKPTASNLADPILAALRSYRGQVVDLENDLVVEGVELGAATDATAAWLREIGLSEGDRVVFSVGNGPAFTAAFCGVLAAGGSPIVLHGDTPTQDLLRCARLYSARFVLCQHTLDESDVAGEVTSNSQSLTDWLNLHATEIPFEPQSPIFPSLPGASLHPTSGSTGRAKIAVRTAVQTVAEARHYVDTMQITARDRILCVVPMSHAYGFGMGFMVSLLSGACLVTVRQFNPRTLARVLADQRITVFPAVPAMLDLMMRAGGNLLNMPRLVLAAGAPLGEATSAEFRQLTGQNVTPLYGTTETGGITVAVGESEGLPAGCVGRPMQCVEAHVVPIADAAELPAGVGRIMIRSSSMMSGYLMPEGVDSTVLRDGWFETGDLGRIDEHGRIHLVAREKEIINVFGLKVIPSEVEEVVAALEGVREVKVYAGKHRSGSDIVVAAVAVNGATDTAQIRAHCEANLPAYKRPQVLHLVDALPRTPTGKIVREKLP